MSDFKAISENVMHSSTLITDAVYSSLKGNELKSRIQSLAQDSKGLSSKDEAILALEEALKILKQ